MATSTFSKQFAVNQEKATEILKKVCILGEKSENDSFLSCEPKTPSDND